MLFFVLYFMVVLFFVDILYIFVLNFNRNRQNINITMQFQDALCPPIAVSVLSSSVEPPPQLQSLAVSVSSSLDVTVMTRRSTWSWVGAL